MQVAVCVCGVGLLAGFCEGEGVRGALSPTRVHISQRSLGRHGAAFGIGRVQGVVRHAWHSPDASQGVKKVIGPRCEPVGPAASARAVRSGHTKGG